MPKQSIKTFLIFPVTTYSAESQNTWPEPFVTTYNSDQDNSEPSPSGLYIPWENWYVRPSSYHGLKFLWFWIYWAHMTLPMLHSDPLENKHVGKTSWIIWKSLVFTWTPFEKLSDIYVGCFACGNNKWFPVYIIWHKYSSHLQIMKFCFLNACLCSFVLSEIICPAGSAQAR